MHAVVVRVKIEDFDKAQPHLHERVVPGVQRMPGFQCGVWLAPSGGTGSGEGLSVVVFDTEDKTREGANMVRENAPEDVEVLSVDVREVAASA